VVVNPGDIIVGDAMGVVVVPQEVAADLLERLKQHAAANEAYLETVRSGVFSNAWVDKILTELECPLVRGPTLREVVSPAGRAPDSETPSPLPSPGGRGGKGAGSPTGAEISSDVPPLPPGEGRGEGVLDEVVRPVA
jgi:hypothetical protein